ncbi:hypothetical protein niasHT_023175 [Heterodera trifolii]|uniref:BZIP domain-containing protein n=1 Tax=Heterodera trifolii TaxID=157864 RepID=A0ABD2JDA4_9BILA
MSSGKFDWFLSSLTPESQVPSTAEIIQKCLSVNPFDLKFREANLQINGQGPQSGSSADGTSGSLPTTSGLGSLLNLPSTLSSLTNTHSPGIFSNINVLTADIEGELRKTIDLSRKVQQLRENGLLSNCKQEDGQLKTPCTSDVLNAVLDMQHINGGSAAHCQQHHLGSSSVGSSSPFISSTSLLAGLNGLKAALTNSAHSSGQEAAVHSHLVPTSSIPNFKLESAHAGPSSSFTPVAAQGKTMSSPDLHLQANISSAASKQLHSPILSSEALLALHHASCSATLSVPANLSGGGQSNLSFSAQSSPGGSGGSLRSSALSPSSQLNGNGLTDLSGPSKISPMLNGKSGDDQWKIGEGIKQSVCPPQISISQQSPYSKGPDSVTSKASSDMSKDSFHNAAPPGGKEKTRKYTKFYGGSADSQVSSTRGGRGRRSIINELLPDERRQTILERNKAAAVRYRKRKKEEHDDMITRVTSMEQEKNALETQNSVLRRELERLNFLLQERESRCVCKANQLQVGVSVLDESRSPSVGFMNGYGVGGGAHQQLIRPSSSHSTQ